MPVSFAELSTEGEVSKDETGEITEIGEDNVPLAEVPETGDSTALWALIAGASGAALVWLTISNKKFVCNNG